MVPSPNASNSNNAWNVNANNRNVDIAYDSGVRPAIEVSKTNIDY